MVDARLLKGKTKVLTSTNQEKLEQLIPRGKYRPTNTGKLKRRRDKQKSRYEQGGTSKAGAIRPQVTSRILLNKWQW